MPDYKPKYRRSHALLAGIDNYPSDFPPLNTAVKGVRALADVLSTDLGFEPENIITLENEQASREAILSTITDSFTDPERVGPDDRVLIYFAGHGATFDVADGEIGYIVPYDADGRKRSSMLAMDELTRLANQMYAKHILFLLDACFSGYATTRAIEGSQRQLNDYLTSPVRQVITAGKREQVVDDAWGPDGHSLFTGFLIDGLRGAAPQPGGILRTFHLAGYLQDVVAQHSRSVQTPQYASLIGSRGGDFILHWEDNTRFPEDIEVAQVALSGMAGVPQSPPKSSPPTIISKTVSAPAQAKIPHPLPSTSTQRVGFFRRWWRVMLYLSILLGLIPLGLMLIAPESSNAGLEEVLMAFLGAVMVFFLIPVVTFIITFDHLIRLRWTRVLVFIICLLGYLLTMINPDNNTVGWTLAAIMTPLTFLWTLLDAIRQPASFFRRRKREI